MTVSEDGHWLFSGGNGPTRNYEQTKKQVHGMSEMTIRDGGWVLHLIPTGELDDEGELVMEWDGKNYDYRIGWYATAPDSLGFYPSK